MPYCINCGAEVLENETVCKDCGYSPKIKGKKMLKKSESVEGFEEVIKEAPKAAAKESRAEKIFCPSCGKKFEKTLYKCTHCGASNPYQDFPLHNYVIYTFLAYGAIVMLFLITFSIIFVLASPQTLPYLWLGGIFYMLVMIIGVPVSGIITYMLYLLGRFIRTKMSKEVPKK
jgi:DNA-directed RNA polymerase subunit RPC12/RpoP